MAAPKKSIDFLQEDDLKKSPFGIFLNWALTIGRYIIIFTELIVIGVFISRFKLDDSLTDLNNEISRKQKIIDASSELENEIIFLQKRLELIKQAQAETLQTDLILNSLTKIIPLDVYFTDLTLQKNSISLAGASVSNSGLATFLNGLRSSSQFTNLNLETIVSRGEKEPFLEFQLTASLINQSSKKNKAKP